MSRRRRHQEGQILVIAVGGATALVLLLGLVVDVGIAFVNRRDGQSTADMIALAGAKHLADSHRGLSPGSLSGALRDAADENDCKRSAPVPCEIVSWNTVGPSGESGGDLGVHVVVVRRPATLIVRLANIAEWQITTEATALAERTLSAPPTRVLPIGLRQRWVDEEGDPGETTFEPGQVYDFSLGKNAPNRFGFIAWGGASVGSCVANNPGFTLPATLVVNPSGAGDVDACQSQWAGSGETVLVVMYEEVDSDQPNASYLAVGLGAFVFTARQPSAPDSIRGYFVEAHPYLSPQPGGGQAPTEDDPTYFIGLVK